MKESKNLEKNIFIVIAAYNEEKKIKNVLFDLKKHNYKNIIVVDDGSKDNTYEVAIKEKVIVLRHIINRGQGAALKTGIDFAIKKKASIIITFDADGQFLSSDIERMIQPIIKNEADITLGSRFLGKAINIPFLKKLTLKLGIIVVFFLYGIKVSDSQCGFRAFTLETAKKINILSDRMEHAGDFFSEIIRNKLRYKEVPITVIYSKYSLLKGQSWDKSIILGLKMLFRKFLK
ncbi:MAG: glycosyltransferase family 2 protein [Candidatus Woesearchaeota archaeon]